MVLVPISYSFHINGILKFSTKPYNVVKKVKVLMNIHDLIITGTVYETNEVFPKHIKGLNTYEGLALSLGKIQFNCLIGFVNLQFRRNLIS